MMSLSEQLFQALYFAHRFLITEYHYEIDKVVPYHGMGYAYIGYKNKDKNMPYINVNMEKSIVWTYFYVGKQSISFEEIYKYFHIDKKLHSSLFYKSKKDYSKDIKMYFDFYYSIKNKPEFNIKKILDFYNKYEYSLWAVKNFEDKRKLSFFRIFYNQLFHKIYLPSIKDLRDASDFLITDYSYREDKLSSKQDGDVSLGFKNDDKKMPYVIIKMDNYSVTANILEKGKEIRLDVIYKYYHIDKCLRSSYSYNKDKNFQDSFSKNIRRYFDFYLSVKDKINFTKMNDFYKKYPWDLWATWDNLMGLE